jgi:uncharacterized protein (PEP-CTERM system associated)
MRPLRASRGVPERWIKLLVTLFVAAPISALAQWVVNGAVQANTTVTTNVALASKGQERKDLVTFIQPTFQLLGQGPKFKLNALMGLDGVSYARRSSADKVSPLVRADLNATLVDRLLFVDSSVDVRNTEINAYASRTAQGTTQNQQLSSTYRLSPYFSYQLSPFSTATTRYEEVLSRSDETSNQRFSKIEARLQRQPQPWGGSIELLRQDVRFSGSGEGRWSLASYKLVGDWAVSPGLVVGPVLGQERSTLFLQSHTDTLYGAHLKWNPNERLQVLAEADHRFFGTGWDLSMRHRTPAMSFLLQWTRAPITTASSLGVAAAGSDLSVFLNNILTTRYPDAVERRNLVNDLISTRGLRKNQPSAVDVVAEYAQLQTGVNATWVLLSARNTVSVSIYQQTLNQLVRSGDDLSSLLTVGSDNRQRGVSLNLNRKLTPQSSLDAVATWSQIVGLAQRSGDESQEQTYRLSWIRSVSPRTAVSLGLQHRKLNTSVVGIDSYAATAAFAGVNHRF